MSEQQQPKYHPIETVRILQERFPSAFPPDGHPPKPLAVGIFDAIREATSDDISTTKLKRALAWWCGRLAYVVQIAAGGQRYDLQGNPAGEVSDDNRQSAVQRAVEIKAKLAAMAARRKAEAQAKRDAAAKRKADAKAEARAAKKAARAAEAASKGKGQDKGQSAPTALSEAFQQAAATVAPVKADSAVSADPKKRAKPEFSEPGKKVAPRAGGAVVGVAISRRPVLTVKGAK